MLQSNLKTMGIVQDYMNHNLTVTTEPWGNIQHVSNLSPPQYFSSPSCRVRSFCAAGFLCSRVFCAAGFCASGFLCSRCWVKPLSMQRVAVWTLQRVKRFPQQPNHSLVTKLRFYPTLVAFRSCSKYSTNFLHTKEETQDSNFHWTLTKGDDACCYNIEENIVNLSDLDLIVASVVMVSFWCCMIC